MQDPTVLSPDNARFVRAMAPGGDDTLAEMESLNRERAFPMVGPEVGGALRLFARMVDARRVFEFGSGLGYSAYWFATALPDDGLVVLTDDDPAELDTAREFFERGGLAGRAAFEAGDAHETFERYDGPFDVVLIDHVKARYAEAFEATREKLAPGGLIIADNTMRTAEAVDLPTVNEHLSGGDPEMNDSTAGVAAYLDAVRSDPDFETVALPLGEGITVSLKS